MCPVNLDCIVGRGIKLTRKIGFLVLAIWLVLNGLIPLLHLSFSGIGVVMAGLSIAAGVLIAVAR